MRKERLILIAIAMLALGVLALPSTVTLFAGEHVWYKPEELPCQKCHADVAAELTDPSNYVHNWSVPEACYACHKVNGTNYYPGSPSLTFKKHAATVVDCERCHDVGYLTCFENDPHYEFVNKSKESSHLPNATEACVGCHTHARVQINFTWAKYEKFNATVNESADRSTTNAGPGLWNVTDFCTNGTETHFIWEYGAYVWNGTQYVPYTPPPE